MYDITSGALEYQGVRRNGRNNGRGNEEVYETRNNARWVETLKDILVNVGVHGFGNRGMTALFDIHIFN